MKKNYLQQMVDAGYAIQNIDDFHKIALPFLGEKFFPDKDLKILDIGAGSGHSLIPLKSAGWKNLWALDLDDFNKNMFQNNGINFVKVDLELDKASFNDNFFDVILSFHVIEHIKNLDNYLNEIGRVLKKDGIFILVTPDWRKQYKTFWRDHTHVHPYDKESVERALKCYGFNPVFIKRFGVLRGVGRLGIWKIFKPFIFTGIDLIAVSKKIIYKNAKI